ncbi:MAG: glycosyltransferase family 2 protein [Sedimentisphaerales bacterium]|nr:glycosyltransferase family 2 protein [Sedimentisphaerales bacterium]
MASVSVCIPTFNRKDYLREALESVQAQTRKVDEILVLDDGSTDGTAQMLARADYPVRYEWQRNQGDATARNRLIEMAQGQYVAFLDSDDLLMPRAIERMMAAVDREAEDVIVYGSYVSIDEEGQPRPARLKRLCSGFITPQLFEEILLQPSGSLFPKRALEQAGGFDSSLWVCSDYDMWLRLSLTHRFVALRAPTCKRRRHATNLSASSTPNRLTELSVLERFYYEKGGCSVVPAKRAFRRLSQEAYRAARCALAERDYETACCLLSKSMRWHPNGKSLFYAFQARIGRRFNGQEVSAVVDQE